jgi:predicted DNA-binding ribbon-helix-helix protein
MIKLKMDQKIQLKEIAKENDLSMQQLIKIIKSKELKNNLRTIRPLTSRRDHHNF